MEIAFALSVLLVFLIWQQRGDLASTSAILTPLLGVWLVLFGLYLIIRKIFGGSGGRKSSSGRGPPGGRDALSTPEISRLATIASTQGLGQSGGR